MSAVYTRSLPVIFLYRFSRETRNAPCPKRGMTASAIHWRSMLQARTGRWGWEGGPEGAEEGSPSVTRTSISN